VIGDKAEVAIIGAGPAGIAAALQFERYGIRPAVFEKNEPGGLLHDAGLVENYPGFPGGIEGPQLAGLLAEQLLRSGAVLKTEHVTSVRISDERIEVESEKGGIVCEALVVASGTSPVRLDGPGGFLYSIREIRETEEKFIVVIGTGDAAFDYALSLGSRNEVVIVGRGGSPKANRSLLGRAEASRTVRFLEGETISAISRDQDGRFAVDLGKAGSLDADHIVVAVGREPELGFMPAGDMPGRIGMAGDVRNGIYRQAAIAAGDGVMAAMRIYESKGLDG
jgi:thioredoxin reductase